MSKCCCDDCVKKICPLPRIGSTEWGWHYGRQSKTWVVYDSERRIRSNEIGDWVVQEDIAEVGDSKSAWVTVGFFRKLRDAKRFLELLARRDWRRENVKR